jgi:hypothetical protein
MNELMDENYLDAYELIECPAEEVKEFVHSLPINLGRPIPSDEWYREDVAKQIGKFLADLPVQNMSVGEIVKLNNLANMPEDLYTLQTIEAIKGQEGYKETYIKEMLDRDKRDFREREFSLETIIEAVETGSCRPVLVVKLNNGQYVIDGRTRLYAAIAANKDAKVIMVDDKNLKEYLGGV